MGAICWLYLDHEELSENWIFWLKLNPLLFLLFIVLVDHFNFIDKYLFTLVEMFFFLLESEIQLVIFILNKSECTWRAYIFYFRTSI